MLENISIFDSINMYEESFMQELINDHGPDLVMFTDEHALTPSVVYGLSVYTTGKRKWETLQDHGTWHKIPTLPLLCKIFFTDTDFSAQELFLFFFFFFSSSEAPFRRMIPGC